MTVKTNQQATITQDQWTKLAAVSFGPVRVTVTGMSGEFDSIHFRAKRGFKRASEFDALEAAVSGFSLFGFGDISAKPPAGVGTLDIVYEVRTKDDA
jgi:hypothetical protein